MSLAVATGKARFRAIVERLREERAQMLVASKSRRGGASKVSKPRRTRTLSFDNPELERIFNAFPGDVKEYLKKI